MELEPGRLPQELPKQPGLGLVLGRPTLREHLGLLVRVQELQRKD